jgi:hypothetical protein
MWNYKGVHHAGGCGVRERPNATSVGEWSPWVALPTTIISLPEE